MLQSICCFHDGWLIRKHLPLKWNLPHGLSLLHCQHLVYSPFATMRDPFPQQSKHVILLKTHPSFTITQWNHMFLPWHDLAPHPSLIWSRTTLPLDHYILTTGSLYCSLNKSNTLLPQGLLYLLSFCLQHSPLLSPHPPLLKLSLHLDLCSVSFSERSSLSYLK